MDEVKSWKLLEYLKLFPPEVKEFMARQERRGQEEYDSSQHNYQVRFIKKSGDIGWLDLFSSAIQYKGRPAGMVSIIDITDRLQAENKIRESEEKFRNITEQSIIGVLIITGEDWDIKYSNQKFADIIGYKREEIEDWKLENFFKLVHPEDVEDLIKLAKRKYEGGLEIVKNYQFRVFKKTGEIIWIEIDSKTIPYKYGLADLVSVIDITEKKEAEKLIIEENTKLLELHEMRKDIINRVSHELKTPLTSIYGASEILMAKFKNEMSDNVLEFMEILYRGAIRLKELVDNLLDASILDADKFELKLNNEDVVEIIKGSVNEMAHLASVREIGLNMDVPDALFFDVDKLRLRQAIHNLISNAIKNTPLGGKVSIVLIDRNNFVEIKVKDNGVGITEKEKEKLFEKFGKIERYGMNLDVDIEGSGLGLYISKEIIELHGGRILVESEGRNKGSIFTIRLFKNR